MYKNMKNKFIYILIASFSLSILSSSNPIFAQNPDDMIIRAEKLEEGKENEYRKDTINRGGKSDTTSVSIGRRHVTVIEGKDTTSISLGRREIRIIEKDGHTSVRVHERDENHHSPFTRRQRFRGNWRGLEIGLNNYLNKDFSTSLGSQNEYMELRTGKSFNVNLNFLQYDFRVAGDNFGLVTGMGFEFNDYRFTNNYNITKFDREIVPVSFEQPLEKTKLSTVYLTVPLLVEFQTQHRRRWNRVYFSAGVIGGLNLGAHTKVVYRENSRKQKDKVRDDFYLSPFRYGLTFRTGYRAMNIFANYYPTPLFQTGKGPELYPVSVGFSLLGF
jgi:hypothetical protein